MFFGFSKEKKKKKKDISFRIPLTYLDDKTMILKKKIYVF